MERLSDQSYGKNIIDIGPNEQRFGAWARVLPANEGMQFRINSDFLKSCKNNNIPVRVVYYDAKGKDFKVIINSIPSLVTCERQNTWNTKVIEIKDRVIKPDDKNVHITIQNGSEMM